jgi:hypothetical protein
MVVLKECLGTSLYGPIKTLRATVPELVEDDEQGWLETLISGSAGSLLRMRNEPILDTI